MWDQIAKGIRRTEGTDKRRRGKMKKRKSMRNKQVF